MKGNWFYALLIIGVVGYFGGRYLYFKPKLNDGDTAIDFSATLANGETFNLSDLSGHYILIDFWGSWCGPCRQENPALVELYNALNPRKYRDAEGFEIVSIGIESKESSWLQAIERDGLLWKYHIGQMDRFKSPIAKLFGVREIPTKFLIGPEGDVIDVNPTVQEVYDLLSNQQSPVGPPTH